MAIVWKMDSVKEAVKLLQVIEGEVVEEFDYDLDSNYDDQDFRDRVRDVVAIYVVGEQRRIFEEAKTLEGDTHG